MHSIEINIKVGDKVYIKPKEIYGKWVTDLYGKPLTVIKIVSINEIYIHTSKWRKISWSIEELITNEGYNIYGKKMEKKYV